MGFKIPFPMVILPDGKSFMAFKFHGLDKPYFDERENVWRLISRGLFSLQISSKEEAEKMADIIQAAVERALQTLSPVDLTSHGKPSFQTPQLEPLCDLLREFS